MGSAHAHQLRSPGEGIPESRSGYRSESIGTQLRATPELRISGLVPELQDLEPQGIVGNRLGTNLSQVLGIGISTPSHSPPGPRCVRAPSSDFIEKTQHD